MSYLEEIFERAELQFASMDRMLDWLSSFERPKKVNAYTKDAVKVRDDLIKVKTIQEDIESANTFKEINSLSKEAEKIPYDNPRDETLGKLNDRIRMLEGEAEEAKEIFKETRKLEEREKAEERLRELAPKSFGGIRSGEVRRGKTALKNFPI